MHEIYCPTHSPVKSCFPRLWHWLGGNIDCGAHENWTLGVLVLTIPARRVLAVAIPYYAVCFTGEAISLTGDQSVGTSFHWTQTAGVLTALQCVDCENANFIPPRPGRYEFVLTVTDGDQDAKPPKLST